MNRKKIILIFIVAIMLFVGVNKVNATCYSYEAGGKTNYTTVVDKLMQPVKTVDDSYCNINETDNKKSNNNSSTSNTVTYNNFEDAPTSCGNGKVKNIPSALPKVISVAYTLIQIAIPIVLVIMGSLDLFKGITAQKEDEMKKGQQIFIKRLIYAALIFFVFAIVRIVVSLSSEDNETYILDCAECFIKNKCD